MNKTTITLTVALAGLLLLSSGAAIGAALRPALEANAETPTNPVPCTLRLVWDRSEQRYQAVYEDSAMISYTPTYGRVANLSCTDAEMLEWQGQRESDGQDSDVCRSVLQSDVAGNVYPIGCASPTMAVTGEPR